jgi:deoxyribose-phosphate aldolase
MTIDLSRILGLIDLTSLKVSDDEPKIAALAKRAVSPFGAVAAVCVWPRLISAAGRALDDPKVRLAAVANFPTGAQDLAETRAEVRTALSAGANEIDLVFPYQQFLRGEPVAAEKYVADVRASLPAAITLKVILETGAHPDAEATRQMAQAAIRAGADFLKTSTGKIAIGATLEVVAILLDCATHAARPIGVKASGGIRHVSDVENYLALADQVFGAPVNAAQFRFGASSLLGDVLARLQPGQSPIATDKY